MNSELEIAVSFLRGESTAYAVARALGLLDSIMVRSGDDILVSITLYEDEDSAATAWQRARALIERHYGHALSFVGITSGRADDMPDLTRR